MEKYFVTLDIAKDLQILKFNNPCLGSFEFVYNKTKLCLVGQPNDRQINTTEDFDMDCEDSLLAPMWEQVIDWLEIKHNLLLNVSMNVRGGNYGDWKFTIEKFRNATDEEKEKTNAYHIKKVVADGGFWETREQAQRYGVKKALSLLINNHI